MAQLKTKKKTEPKKAEVPIKKSREWMWFTLVLGVVLIAHFPSLFNGFTNWDDPAYITKNEFIKSLNGQNLKTIFCDFHSGHYHPLTWISLALNYLLFELNPFGYHLFSLLYHLINVWLVYSVIKALVKNWQVALITALFFGITPLSVETVSWVTEQKNLLFTAFFLGSMYVYIKYLESNKSKFYLFSILLFVFSVFSKSMAITLPVILILIDYVKERKLFSTKVIIEKVPFFVISLVFGLITIFAQEKTITQEHLSIPFDAKMAYGAWGFTKYVVLTFLPFQLTAFYPYIIDNFPVYYFSGWLFIAVFLWFIWYSYKRKNRIIVFGLLFFLVNIFLLLKFFNIPYGSYFMADRYTYISSIGLFFILAYFLFSFKKPVKGLSSISILILAFFTLFFGAYAFSRSQVWKSSLTLWNDVISKYPGAHVPLLNRGNAFRDEVKYADAIQDYSKIINEDSTYFEAFVNRGYVFDLLGNYKEAVSDYNRALVLNPKDKNTIYNRALCYQKMGDNSAAVMEIEEAMKKGDVSAASYNILGNASFANKKLDDAVEQYSIAIEKEPDEAQYWYNRANAKAMQKKQKEAIPDYDKAIELDNSVADYYFNRGTTKYFLKENLSALADMRAAIKLNPKNASYYLNKSTIEMVLDNLEEAAKDISSAIELDVNNAQNYARRAVVYFKLNKKGLGCTDANTAVRLGYAPAKELLNTYCK